MVEVISISFCSNIIIFPALTCHACLTKFGKITISKSNFEISCLLLIKGKDKSYAKTLFKSQNSTKLGAWYMKWNASLYYATKVKKSTIHPILLLLVYLIVMLHLWSEIKKSNTDILRLRRIWKRFISNIGLQFETIHY